MIRTNWYWRRAKRELREQQGRLARKKPVVFNCACYRCWECQSHKLSILHAHISYVNSVGNPETEMLNVPVCHDCGKPAQRKDGSYFDLQHTDYCKKGEIKGSIPGINTWDWPVFIALLDEAIKLLDYMIKIMETKNGK